MCLQYKVHKCNVCVKDKWLSLFKNFKGIKSYVFLPDFLQLKTAFGLQPVERRTNSKEYSSWRIIAYF